MFPDPQHPEVFPLERSRYLFVSANILRNLCDPKGLIRRRHPKAFLACVPKTTVHKHSDPGGGKIKIGAPDNSAGLHLPTGNCAAAQHCGKLSVC